MSDAVEHKIISIIQEIKNIPAIDPDETLLESGVLDSFDIINLIAELESYFQISIPGEAIIPENLGNIRDIARLVRSQQLQ